MTLNLSRPPIAIGFLDSVPENITRWDGGVAPAGCAFWKHAFDGQTFYTLPNDHYNCAIGAHTHHIGLPEDRAAELGDTVGFMVDNGYIKLEEVPGIPTLNESPAAIAYGPADTADFTPSVILIAAEPQQAMLLYEAAVHAGAGSALLPSLGRPGCAVLPLSINTDRASISLGCAGNRTFTSLKSTEMYVCIPADRWADVQAKFGDVLASNSAMQAHYDNKRVEGRG